MTAGEVTIAAVFVFFMMQQVYLTVLAKRAAEKVAEVKVVLEHTTATQDAKLDDIAKVGEATHTLCNSAMGEQLKLNAATTGALYKAEPTEVNRVAAELAKAALAAHDKKQSVVDSGRTTPVTPGNGRPTG